MRQRSSSTNIRIIAAVVTGAIALTGYAGTVGLVGGGLTFGPAIDARLPFQSLVLAGLALLAFVALPMTIAALAAQQDRRFSGDLVFASGLMLVLWIAVQLAFIKTYSWFHPTYLAAAIVVLGLGLADDRWPSRPPRSGVNERTPDPARARTDATDSRPRSEAGRQGR